MTLLIEDRISQMGPQLGDQLGPIVTISPGIRIAPFYNACLLEIGGETFVLSEATIADKFLPRPA